MKKINHIAIIMDGNRRFSKKLGLEITKGHEYGAKKIEEVIKWCKEKKIRELTLYAFSYENFSRPKKEFNYLMNLFSLEFEKLMKNINKAKNKGVKIRFIGRIEMFPKDVYKKMKKLMEITKNNNKFIINFAMAYSGRIEIVDAIKKIISKKIPSNKINTDIIDKHVYLESQPDILIRTGGEKRLSNFLLWYLSYTELFFIDKLWPEFTKKDFDAVIEEFYRRERRFGK